METVEIKVMGWQDIGATAALLEQDSESDMAWEVARWVWMHFDFAAHFWEKKKKKKSSLWFSGYC